MRRLEDIQTATRRISDLITRLITKVVREVRTRVRARSVDEARAAHVRPTRPDAGAMTSGPAEPRKWLVYGALLGVVVGNTAYNVVTKWALPPGDTAFTLCFSLFRDVLAFPLLQAGALCVDGARLPTRRDVPTMALLGLLGMFGNQFLFIYGLSDKSVSATLASVVSQTQPVFGALLAVMARQATASWMLALGVLLAFGGSAVMARVWSAEVRSPDELLHLGSLLLGSACMAAYYVVQAPVLRRLPPLTVTAWAYFFGALWMGLASLVYFLAKLSPSEREALWPAFGTARTLGALANAILVNSVLKYALQSFANRWVGPTTLTAWTCLVPVLTGLVGALWPALGEKPSLAYLGALPVMAGVICVSVAREREKRALMSVAAAAKPGASQSVSLSVEQGGISPGHAASQSATTSSVGPSISSTGAGRSNGMTERLLS